MLYSLHPAIQFSPFLGDLHCSFQCKLNCQLTFVSSTNLMMKQTARGSVAKPRLCTTVLLDPRLKPRHLGVLQSYQGCLLDLHSGHISSFRPKGVVSIHSLEVFLLTCYRWPSIPKGSASMWSPPTPDGKHLERTWMLLLLCTLQLGLACPAAHLKPFLLVLSPQTVRCDNCLRGADTDLGVMGI